MQTVVLYSIMILSDYTVNKTHATVLRETVYTDTAIFVFLMFANIIVGFLKNP